MPESTDTKQFDFPFDPTLEMFGNEPESIDDVGIDPGVFLPNTEGRSEFLPPDVEHMPQIPNVVDRDAPAYAARPAEERTRELFAHMAPHRQVLLGVLREATEPCSDEHMKDVIEELRAHKFSVYSPSNICTMLESAGALERVTSDGTAYDDYIPKPDIEVVDGEEYWVPTDPPEVYWQITEAGHSALERNDPEKRILAQLERESEFAHLYKRILSATSKEEGATMPQLSALVDSDPSIAKPRRFFVQHFADNLERCECIAWQGRSWKSTPLGERILNEQLADVCDDDAPELAEAPKRVPIETQGLNW